MNRAASLFTRRAFREVGGGPDITQSAESRNRRLCCVAISLFAVR